MNRFRLAAAFCEPSLFSATTVIIASIVLLVGSNVSFLLKSGLFYEALLGKNSPYGLIESSKETLTAFNQVTLGNAVLNKLLFFAFWMMVGLIVYASISSIGHMFGEVEKDVQTLGYIHARKRMIEQNLFLRFALRVAAAIGFVLFSIVMLRLLFPFCVLAVRVGLGQLTHYMGPLYCLLGFSVLVLCLHVYVIILRLIWLRPRIFAST